MKLLDIFFFILYFIVISLILVNGFFFFLGEEEEEEERFFIGITSLLFAIVDGGMKFLLIIAYIDLEPKHLILSWYKASIPLLPVTICLFIIYVFALFVECLDCRTDMFLALLFHCHVTYLFARPSISEWIRS